MPRAKAKCTLVVPDIHFPHEDKVAMEVMRKVFREVKPHRVVLLGDVMNCAGFARFPSKYTKDPKWSRSQYEEDELGPTMALLDFFMKYGAEVDYCEGNHEQWILDWCVRTRGAEGLVGTLDPERRLREGRSASRFRWHPHRGVNGGQHNSVMICPDKPKNSALWATHGWSHAKNAAEKHMQIGMGISVVFGHTHRAEMKDTRNPKTGQRVKSFTPGCLCGFTMPYTESNPTTWVHGISLVWEGRSSYTASNAEINGNSCIVDGKEIRV